ncbi:NAD(P)-binding protein, partial [Meira miltonrushii]
KNLFLIGPGFIGGSLLVRLKETRPDLNLRALTRREEQAKELRSLGIEPILGELNDAATIKKAVQESDIVIHTATADDAPSAFAVVDGIKERKDKNKKIIYIQTSGNDELTWSAKSLAGTSIEERTLSDAEGDETLENGRIQPDAYHRHVDGPLREKLFNDEAEKEFNASTTIMMPPLIYGIGSEPWKRISIQIPMLTTTMLKKGLFTLPEGFKGAWNGVWVHDLVEAYLVLLKELEAHTPG